MIDAQQVAEMWATVTATATQPGHTVKPIPTVVPTPPEFQRATDSGHTALWVVFALMLISSGVFAGLSWNIPVSRRLYHVITTIITLVATLSYFAMATGSGKSLHFVHGRESHDKVPDTWHPVFREVYWARYVDWAITTPLLLLDLSLLAGIDGAHTLLAIVADLIMVLSGLFSAYGRQRTPQKWGWYAIACVSYLFVIWHIGLHGSRVVRAKGNKVVRLFSGLGLFTLILWTVYPIVWAVTEGTRKASVDSEIFAFAVLDVLAKGVFGFWLLLSHRSVPETNVEIGGYWSHGLASEGRIRIGDDEDA